MKLSKIIFGSFLAVALMICMLTFTYGFAENYGLNETMNYTNSSLSDFTGIREDMSDTSYGIQTNTSGVLSSGGESDSLIAGLWIIPEVLGALQVVPDVLVSTNNIITYLLVDMVGVPSWVSGYLITVLTLSVFLIILAVLLKSGNII